MTASVHDLASEARLSAQEYAGFIEQCGSTRDDRYKRDEHQMARMRFRLRMKQQLADFMERSAAQMGEAAE